jgi:acyl carrier protein
LAEQLTLNQLGHSPKPLPSNIVTRDCPAETEKTKRVHPDSTNHTRPDDVTRYVSRASVLVVYIASFSATVATMPSPNTRVDLERKLCEVVAEMLRLDPEQIRMEDDLVVDLGADSLALAELSMQLEQRMGVKIPGEEWLEVTAVGELADLIERHQRS